MAEMEEIGYHNILEIDVSDEEIEVEDLERRMWKDRIKLQRLKEKQKLAAQEAAEKQKPRQSQAQENYSYIHANNIVSLENMYVSGRPLHYPPIMPHETAYNLDLTVAEYGPRQEGQHQHLQPGLAVNIDPIIRQPENAAITMPAANMKGDEITGGDINYFAKDAFQNELDRFGSPITNMSFDFGVLDNPPSPPFLLDDFMGMGDDEMIQYFGG